MRFKRTISVMFVALSAAGGWGIGQSLRADPVVPPSGGKLRAGEELLLVFVGASWCAASKDTALRTIVPTLVARIAAEARKRNATLVRIGVATDWVLEDGFAFLKPFGPFDEMIVGRSWLNSGYDRYVRDRRGAEGLPQIILISRQVVMGRERIFHQGEKHLGSAVGPKGIMAWHSDTTLAFLSGVEQPAPSRDSAESRPYQGSLVPIKSSH